MTTIQNNTVSTALLDSVNGTKSTTSGSTAADVQDRFLKLLVTQMKNQDPLNPMDNAQVTSQMAQLSTVSGIDKLNTTLLSLITSSQQSQTFQAASMIGRSVLLDGNQFPLANGNGKFGIDLPSSADSVNITIRNVAGTAVKQIALGAQQAGVIPLQWAGDTDAGTMAPDGNYTFDITTKAGGQTIAASPLIYQGITSISNGSQGLMLNLSNNSSIGTNAVKQIF